MTPVRRAALLAAPLAVAAVALSACNPVHVNEIVSPTPSGSALATPYTAHESEAASESAAPVDRAIYQKLFRLPATPLAAGADRSG